MHARLEECNREALSEAMPKAHITLSYTEVGCDFAGKTVAQYGVAVDKYMRPASQVYAAWVERTQSDEAKAILDDYDGDAFEETEELVREEWNVVEKDEIDRAIEAMGRS
jgi:hypothetical protein